MTMGNGQKTRVGLIFGGRSGEYEVSLMSARSVLNVLDPHRYVVTQIGITRDGTWLTGENALEAFETSNIGQLDSAVLLPDPAWDGSHWPHKLRFARSLFSF